MSDHLSADDDGLESIPVPRKKWSARPGGDRAGLVIGIVLGACIIALAVSMTAWACISIWRQI